MRYAQLAANRFSYVGLIEIKKGPTNNFLRQNRTSPQTLVLVNLYIGWPILTIFTQGNFIFSLGYAVQICRKFFSAFSQLGQTLNKASD